MITITIYQILENQIKELNAKLVKSQARLNTLLADANAKQSQINYAYKRVDYLTCALSFKQTLLGLGK